MEREPKEDDIQQVHEKKIKESNEHEIEKMRSDGRLLRLGMKPINQVNY